MPRSRYNLFFYIRLTVLASLLVLAIMSWRHVEELGGSTRILPELLRVHVEREAAAEAELDGRIGAAIDGLNPLVRSIPDSRVAAARTLAEIGLERKKTFVSSGLSVSYGRIGALVRIANNDNSDLHEATGLLTQALADRSERLRLEAAYALSHLQLDTRQKHLTQAIQRALNDEFNVTIKTYLAQALGDIGPAAATTADSVAELLNEDDPLLVASAARALGRMGPGAHTIATEARLLGLLTHSDPAVRDNSAEALGSIGSFSLETETALRAALDDEDAYVRVAASLALADLGLNDPAVVAGLAEGYRLAPRTTLYVDDVARVISIRKRVSEVVTGLGNAPDELIPLLISIATESGDIEHKEQAIELIAGSDGFSKLRARTLVDLLQDREVLVHYAVIDGLTDMGKEVVPLVQPLLNHESQQVRMLAGDVLGKFKQSVEIKVPVSSYELIVAYEQAEDPYARQLAVNAMARHGDPQVLNYLLAHADERVLNGPVLSVAIMKLIADLRQYKWTPVDDLAPRRTALRSLVHLGALTAAEGDAFGGDIENPDMGDQVKDRWRSRLPETPRRPSQSELLQGLYAGLPTPRHKEVAQYAELLLVADRRTRLDALKRLERIAREALEAPTYIHRAFLDPDEKVRTQAVTVFINAELRSPDAVEPLEKVLRNTEQSNYLNGLAARALAQIGKPALTTLSAAATHDEVDIRRAAAYGLLRLGNAAAPALPLLRRLANDPNEGVKTYARKALAGLESSS